MAAGPAVTAPLAGQVLRCACPWCDRSVTALPDSSGDRTRTVRGHRGPAEDDKMCPGSGTKVWITVCWPHDQDRPVGTLRFTQTGSMLRVVPQAQAPGA